MAVPTPPPGSPIPDYFVAHEQRDEARFAALTAAVGSMTARQTLVLGVLQAIATGIVVALKG